MGDMSKSERSSIIVTQRRSIRFPTSSFHNPSQATGAENQAKILQFLTLVKFTGRWAKCLS